MPTFETLPRFEKDWKGLTSQQRGTFRKVVMEAFVPDLMAPDRPFRPGLRVKGVQAHPNVFEMTWDNDGRATVSFGAERARPAARHLAAHRNSRHLHSAARPVTGWRCHRSRRDPGTSLCGICGRPRAGRESSHDDPASAEPGRGRVGAVPLRRGTRCPYGVRY